MHIKGLVSSLMVGSALSSSCTLGVSAEGKLPWFLYPKGLCLKDEEIKKVNKAVEAFNDMCDIREKVESLFRAFSSEHKLNCCYECCKLDGLTESKLYRLIDYIVKKDCASDDYKKEYERIVDLLEIYGKCYVHYTTKEEVDELISNAVKMRENVEENCQKLKKDAEDALIQNGVREKIYLPWDKVDEKYNYLFENPIYLPKIKFDDDVKKENPEIVKEWKSFYKRFCEDFSKRKSMKDVLSKAKFVMSWQSVRDIKEKLEKDNNLIFKHLDFLYDIY